MISKSHYEGYSFALTEIANQENKNQEFKEQAQLLLDLFAKEPKYLKLLGSYDITFKTKEKLLKEAFTNKIDPVIYKMLFILIKKNRIFNIQNILKLFINEINKKHEIHKGIIYSSKQLTNDEIHKIQEKTAKKLNKKIILTNIIDRNIIAGFKIIIDDVVIDATILNQLKELKNELINNDK